MKGLKPLLGTGLILTLALTASASGGLMAFTDVAEDAWYADAVYDLVVLGVIEGYEDSTYRPDNSVNRAELAVILDRLHAALTEPQGDTWTEFENDYYSVWTPAEGTYDDSLFTDGCSSGLMGEGDFQWMITCEDLNEISVEDVLDSWSTNADDVRTSESEINLNGAQALHVVQLALHDDQVIYNEAFFLEDAEHLYVLSSSQQTNPSFEIFTRSFELKNL